MECRLQLPQGGHSSQVAQLDPCACGRQGVLQFQVSRSKTYIVLYPTCLIQYQTCTIFFQGGMVHAAW